MAKYTFYAVTLWVILNSTGSAALECFNCKNINDPSTCNNTAVCNKDEACYHDSVQSGQTKTASLGCINNQACSVSSGSGELVGREISKRQDGQCHECCATDLCNDILCARRNPAACIDDETIDCPRLNSVFGICKDIQHAKSLCPKFCKLCDVVDGAWAEWSDWSTCDVTCENGTQSRSRTCTNPSPAHGGLPCPGNHTETKRCHNQLCPVHGGWSEWIKWGSCSVSCDEGVQTRQRACTNPAPERFGNHCFGLNLDARLCMPAACNDGGWTDWEQWDSCSVTCGEGFHTRSRTCTNPRPFPHGKNCNGDTLQVGSCSKMSCKGRTIAFRSKDVTGSSILAGQRFVFGTVTLNEGNGYDKSTGIFTAPIGGTYMFSVQFCVTDYYSVSYAIVVDDAIIKVGSVGDRVWDECYSADTVALLKRSSRAWVKCNHNNCPLISNENMWNTFSGILIQTE